MPFLSQPLATTLFPHEGKASDDLLRRWKPYVIMHVANLLDPQQADCGCPCPRRRQKWNKNVTFTTYPVHMGCLFLQHQNNRK